jgi:hypothetical protein
MPDSLLPDPDPREAGSTGEVIEWQVHLARAQPGKALAVAGAILAAAALCLSLFHNGLFALFTAAALLGATAEFLFPIRYRLTEEAAEMRNLHNWRRITWDEVKKAYLLDEGIKLSPLGVRTRVEPFRGVLLRFGPGAGERETLLAAVRKLRDAAGRDPE